MSAGAASLLNIQRGELTAQGWTQVHTYQVFTTDGTDGPDVVLEASGLPAFGSGLTYDPLARVSRITPNKQTIGGATNHWEVDVEYSRETGNQEDHQKPPTLRPTKRSMKIRWVEKALQQDINGDPIVTSAKTPFNPPLVVSVPHVVAVFQRWENTSDFGQAKVKQYAGKVNATTFGAFDAGEVLCTNIEGTEEWEQNADGALERYWLVTYEFEASDFDKWRPFKVLDADYWFLDPSDSDKRKPIYITSDGTITNNPLDRNGASPAPSPMPLGADGVVLLASELPQGAHFLEFDIYEEAEFNDLNLPVD